MKLILPAVAGSVLSALILVFIDIPLLWMSLLWFGIFLYWTLTEKRQKIKPVWFNVGFLLLVFGGLEAFLWFRENCREIFFEGSYTDNYFLDDDVLGYAPDKGRTVAAEKYNGEDLIYNVTYTINPNGLRLSPPTNNLEGECVLFFGDSFTLGEGVNDTETLPYVVGLESGYDSYNFGFHGYGPHQMLAAIEHGLVAERIEGCSPKFVIYQSFLEHPARAAGNSIWDENGPEYILLADGTVRYNGQFDDDSKLTNNVFAKRVKSQFLKSILYYTLFGRRVVVGEQDIDLMVGIVTASKTLLQENYPGSSFHILYWDFNPQDKNEPLLVNRLQAAGIDVHLVSDILPDYPENLELYRLDDCDNHPNPRANQETADYVVTAILGKKRQGRIDKS